LELVGTVPVPGREPLEVLRHRVVIQPRCQRERKAIHRIIVQVERPPQGVLEDRNYLSIDALESRIKLFIVSLLRPHAVAAGQQYIIVRGARGHGVDRDQSQGTDEAVLGYLSKFEWRQLSWKDRRGRDSGEVGWKEAEKLRIGALEGARDACRLNIEAVWVVVRL